jgi:hypothetical protein
VVAAVMALEVIPKLLLVRLIQEAVEVVQKIILVLTLLVLAAQA